MAIQKDTNSFDKIHIHLGLTDKWQIEEPTRDLMTQPTNKTRYAQTRTDQQIVQARKASVPEKTMQFTKWCVRQWDEWTAHMQEQPDDYTDTHTYSNNTIERFSLLAGAFHFGSSKTRWLCVHTFNIASHSMWADESCERN